ncbi:MAG TPA: phage head morphogenesis protein [Moraxellaceae bacterium]|jgi:SPP1 gp7 family putative phage head morphogenesis protein|nr:phage minor head protein [Moraxella sp.]HCN16245.1 phage head morphogenesis protein [Moraxellaceae bacterium]
MPKTGFDFKSPPQDAIRYLEQKFPKASWAYTDLLDNAHDRAFVVAKMVDVDLATTVQRSIIDAMQEGKGYKAWAKDIDKVLAKSGWYDGQINVDAQGNAKKVVTGGQHRLETIYRTNVAAAYEAGRQQVIFNDRDDDPFGYVMYSAIMDNRTRPTHKALHGKVMEKSDPAWSSISPPNGYNCRCTIVELTQGQIDRYGYKVSKSEGKLSTQVVELPNGKEAQRTLFELDNGAVFKTDVGFNHAPKILPMQTLFDKAILAEPKFASRVVSQALAQPRIKTQVNQEVKTWVQGVDAKYAKGEFRHVGVIPSVFIEALASEKNFELQTAVITLHDRISLHHLAREHKTHSQDWVENIVENLTGKYALYWDNKKNYPVFIFDVPNSKYRLVMRLNENIKGHNVFNEKQKFTGNVIRTITVDTIENIENGSHYALMTTN